MSKIDRTKLAALATIRVYCQPEHIPVRGNYMASGNDAEDKACEDEIIERLNSGDDWAWCCVEVRASYAGIDGADYLGGCSYASEKDFRKSGYYFEDMCERALDELADELERADQELEKVRE